MRLATLNLMGHKYWPARLKIMGEEFNKHGLNASNEVAISLQETTDTPINTTLELAAVLGFEENHCHQFPGMSIITNLNVVRSGYFLLTFDPKDPLEFGKRALGLIEGKGKIGTIILGVTHLSVSPKMQYKNAQECITFIKKFVKGSSSIPKKAKTKFKNYHLRSFCKFLKIAILGDFNASQNLPLYQLIKSGGLEDLTIPLHHKGYSWPANIDWYKKLHREEFGKDPPYFIDQRWMDYIFACGIKVNETHLIGEISKEEMFMSDHLGVVIYC